MNFNISGLPVGFGLSCIENYVLFLLSQYDEDWEYIFYKSYITFDEIFDEFYFKGKKYAYFDRIPRLQKVGIELQKLNFKNVVTNHVGELSQHSGLAAICVKPEYIKQKYKASLWREDHYILLNKVEDKLYQYINDNPQDSGYLSLEALNEIYTGEASIIELKKDIMTGERKEKILQYFYESIVNSNSSVNKLPFIGEIEIDMLRDILGVLRVVIKRIASFCKKYFDVNFLDEYYDYLNKNFTQLEYIRIRAHYNFESLHKMINDVAAKDSIIKNLLVERLEKTYGVVRT